MKAQFNRVVLTLLLALAVIPVYANSSSSGGEIFSRTVAYTPDVHAQSDCEWQCAISCGVYHGTAFIQCYERCIVGCIIIIPEQQQVTLEHRLVCS